MLRMVSAAEIGWGWPGGTPVEGQNRGNSGIGERGRRGGGAVSEWEAPKIDAFSMQNSRSTALVVAGQHATRNPLW